MKQLYFVGLLSLLVFFVAACSPTVDPNKEVIETVIKTAFTLPDEKLMAEMNDPGNATYIGEAPFDGSEIVLNEVNGIEKLLQERYADKFTDYGYEKFTLGPTSVYPMLAEQSGYLITVENVTVEQDKNDLKRYSFEAEITYTTHDGEEKRTTITGRAEFEEEGKIDSLDVNDDGGLAKEMSGHS
jgi:hypothetical protein